MKRTKIITLTPTLRKLGERQYEVCMFTVHEVHDSPVFPPTLLAAGESPSAAVALTDIEGRGYLELEAPAVDRS